MRCGKSRSSQTGLGLSPKSQRKSRETGFGFTRCPISYNGRTYEDGKKISWRDGFAALWFIPKYRFSSNYAEAGKVALDALEQAPGSTSGCTIPSGNIWAANRRTGVGTWQSEQAAQAEAAP